MPEKCRKKILFSHFSDIYFFRTKLKAQIKNKKKQHKNDTKTTFFSHFQHAQKLPYAKPHLANAKTKFTQTKNKIYHTQKKNYHTQKKIYHAQKKFTTRKKIYHTQKKSTIRKKKFTIRKKDFHPHNSANCAYKYFILSTSRKLQRFSLKAPLQASYYRYQVSIASFILSIFDQLYWSKWVVSTRVISENTHFSCDANQIFCFVRRRGISMWAVFFQEKLRFSSRSRFFWSPKNAKFGKKIPTFSFSSSFASFFA